MMATADVLARLSRTRGVRGAIAVTVDDGLVIDAMMRNGERADHLAALAVTVFRRSKASLSAADLGNVTSFQLDAELGHVCAAGSDETLLVAIADRGANVGLIRVELLKAIGRAA